MGLLPFNFHPILIIRYLTDTVFHSFRTHSSNLPVLIVVDYGGYFGGATHMLVCGKSTHLLTLDDHNVDDNEGDC